MRFTRMFNVFNMNDSINMHEVLTLCRNSCSTNQYVLNVLNVLVLSVLIVLVLVVILLNEKCPFK